MKARTTQDMVKPIRDLTTYQKGQNPGEKVVYLTFDDGPSDIVTLVLQQLLD